MKYFFHGFSLLALALSLTSCPNSGAPGGGAVGPYDAQGNYVEAWADDPSKWRHPARDVGGGSAVAKNDLPPPDVTPLPSGGGKPEILLPPTRPSTPDRTVATNTTSKPQPTVTRSTTNRPTASRTTSSRPTGTASRSSSSSKKPTVAKTTKPKPKPKPAVAKTTRHTVRKGDTLSGLASKYGTSVSAIQKANGISGTMIRDGKSLVIPRKK